jgi:hypothetical protein
LAHLPEAIGPSAAAQKLEHFESRFVRPISESAAAPGEHNDAMASRAEPQH